MKWKVAAVLVLVIFAVNAFAVASATAFSAPTWSANLDISTFNATVVDDPPILPNEPIGGGPGGDC